ncbi:MAG: cell division protein FtsQ/DivIB [Solirubrobacteraceae bacterium]
MRTPALPPLPRPPARAVGAFALVLAVLAGAWLWLRDSSLVSVRKVTVTGVSGADAPRVTAALEQAARSMTTLHVRDGQLRTAVQPFPAVIGVEAHSQFPHGMRITVREHVAVGVVTSGGARLPIAADGTVLRGSTSSGLPVIATHRPPATEHVIDPHTAAIVRMLAAAPPQLRAQAAKAFLGARGLTVQLSDGPALYFGGTDRLAAKWAAVATVLADKSSAGVTYLDVRLPERAAAGGLAPPVQPTDTSTTGGTVGAQPAQPSATTSQPNQPTTPSTIAP